MKLTRKVRLYPRLIVACGLLGGLSVLSAGSPAYGGQSNKDVRTSAHKPLSQSLTGAAKADFDAAKLLANDGDFSGALIKFQSAYDQSKDPRLLWNVAFCHKNLRHYAKVLSTLRRYVDEGGAVLSANDKKEAQDLIALIEPFTTKATIRVNESGAAISVDEEQLGMSPLAAPAVLDIGERHIRVTKEGFRTFEKAIPIGGSNEITVDVVLEKELHEGKLIVNAPPNALITLDDKPVGTQKLEQTVLSGGHQIRVTAPGMHPFQTEVVIQDKETRSVDVALEALASSEKPKLLVAVGCADSVPRAPEEGLTVYLDGPDVLSPTQVRRQWSDEKKGNVVQAVEYSVPAGAHRVRVSITDCRAMDAVVNVDARLGAKLEGALESDKFVLFKGPAGSPGSLRVALGLWMPGGGVRDRVPEYYDGKFADVLGMSIEAGLVSRWFALYADGAYGKGSFKRDSFNTHYALPDKANVVWNQLAWRFGPRIPFNVIALGLGVSIGVQELDLEQVRTGKKTGVGGFYGQLDIQPLCDFGLFALGHFQKPFSDDRPIGALQTGLFYQPNARCRKERATKLGLNATLP